MATNLAQVDRSWEQSAAPFPAQRYMQADMALRAIPRGKIVEQIEPKTFNVLGVEIVWIPDGREFPPAILSAINSLYEFAELEQNWDSYSGRPLDVSVVAPTLKLLFASHRRGEKCSRLVPLPSGGVGLRWSSGNRSIEVDLYPGGRCDVSIEDVETDQTQYLDAVTVDEAERALADLR
ncbi:hypothetical protein ACLBKU_11845 [Erythrobacter sp. NE805]|uniref:hypothetical protein n=1 Tax=Erythrobacter sp. NE805 TaxID=3389875 RepID=UPI00396B40FA